MKKTKRFIAMIAAVMLSQAVTVVGALVMPDTGLIAVDGQLVVFPDQQPELLTFGGVVPMNPEWFDDAAAEVMIYFQPDAAELLTRLDDGTWTLLEELDDWFFPMRFVFEELGFDVGWEQDTAAAVLTFRDVTVVVPINSHIHTVNGEEFEFRQMTSSYIHPVPTRLVNDRIMMRGACMRDIARRVVEALGENPWESEMLDFVVMDWPANDRRQIEAFSASERGGRWGFVDVHGTEVVPHIYDYAWDRGTFMAGQGIALYRELYGGISNMEHWRESRMFAWGGVNIPMTRAHAWGVTLDGRVGWINRNGEVIFPAFEYDAFTVFNDEMGWAVVRRNGLHGVANLHTGELIIPMVYTSARNSLMGNPEPLLSQSTDPAYGDVVGGATDDFPHWNAWSPWSFGVWD